MSDDKFDRYDERMRNLEHVINNQVDEIAYLRAVNDDLMHEMESFLSYIKRLHTFIRINNLDPADSFDSKQEGAQFASNLIKMIKNYNNRALERADREQKKTEETEDKEIQKILNNLDENNSNSNKAEIKPQDEWILNALMNANKSETDH